MDVGVGLRRKLSTKELVLLNCGVKKTLKSPLDCKEIQPVHSKGDQSWVFIGRTDAEAETAIIWPPDAESWLIWKDSDAGKDCRQEAKGTTEDEMVGWHHRLDGREFEQAPGVGDGQGSLVCCSPWSHSKSDMTEQLNWYMCVYMYVYIYMCVCVCIYIYMYILHLFFLMLPCKLLQHIACRSLCYTVSPCCLSIIHSSVYVNPKLPVYPSPIILLASLATINLFSMSITLCFVNKFICIPSF